MTLKMYTIEEKPNGRVVGLRFENEKKGQKMDKKEMLENLYEAFDGALWGLANVAARKDYSYIGEIDFNAAMARVKHFRNQIYELENDVITVEEVVMEHESTPLK